MEEEVVDLVVVAVTLELGESGSAWIAFGMLFLVVVVVVVSNSSSKTESAR